MDELEDMLMDFGIIKSDEQMIAELEAKEAIAKRGGDGRGKARRVRRLTTACRSRRTYG